MIEIQGKVISISNATGISRENKVLKAEIVGLKWTVETLTKENEELKKTIGYLKSVPLLEGKAKKKAKEERKRYLKTRRGWKPPEE